MAAMVPGTEDVDNSLGSRGANAQDHGMRRTMRRGYVLFCAAAVALAACSSHGQHESSAERAAATYLTIHNERDHEAARALWGDKVIDLEPLTEWFRAQVGSCSDFSPMHVTSDLDARFVFECERGQIELELRLDAATGVSKRTLIGARGVEPPAHVRGVAEQLVALANGEPATVPTLAARLDRTDLQAQVDVISTQGRCTIDRVHLGNGRGARFVLECANGSRTMLVDLDRHGALRRFSSSEGAADTWRDLD
jgi:hypothetical protein